MTSEVFVSYSRKDGPRVQALVERLAVAGVAVWKDTTSIDGARQWSEEIVEAIASSKVLLLMLSSAAAGSHNVVKEVSLASEAAKPILPVRLEQVEIPPTLRYQLAGIQHLDLSSGREDHGFPGLIRALARLGVRIGPSVVGELPARAATSWEQVFVRLGLPSVMTPRPRFLALAVRHVLEGPVPILMLHGLAGAGKSTLLGAIAREMRGHFPHAVAIRCDGPAAVEPGYLLEELNRFLTSLGRGIAAERLEAQKPESSLEAIVMQMKDLRVLVMLDTVDDMPVPWLETVLRCLVTAPQIRVVMTGRQRPEVRLALQVLAVPPFSDMEATELVAQYRAAFGLDLDPSDVVRRLSPGLRSHPQALATLLALLGDFPLELLLAAGIPEEALAPSRLVEQALRVLEPPTRDALALVDVLSEVQLQTAFQALRLSPPAGFLPALQILLSRALVHRSGRAYVVPALVREAQAVVDPSAVLRVAQELADAWKRVLATAKPVDRDFETLAAIGTRIAHCLSQRHAWIPLRDLTQEPFLESLNARGFWKEYAVMLRLGLDAARGANDRPLRIRLGCRLARKLLQMGDHAEAHQALAEMETLVGAGNDSLERAEVHSHRSLLCQLAGDEDGCLRELTESRRLRESLRDGPGLAVVEKLIGNLHLRRKQYGEARQAFERVNTLFADTAGERNLIEADTSLALCDLAQGLLEASESRLRAVTARCQACGYDAGLPRALLSLAMVVERRGQLAEALQLAREAAQRAGRGDPGVARAATLLVSRLERQDRKGANAS